MIAGLPEPVGRHLQAIGADRGPSSVSCAGTGSIHQAFVGRKGLWFPLAWELDLRPGRSFVWKATARVAGVRRLRTGEEYRARRGQLTVGSRTLEGDAVDRSEYTLLWAWTIALAPAAAARLTGVTWERAGDTAARMLFPHGSETWESTLRFDPSTGLLRRFETKRYELRAGYVRHWVLELAGWKELDGVVTPAKLTMAWDETAATRLEVQTRTETP